MKGSISSVVVAGCKAGLKANFDAYESVAVYSDRSEDMIASLVSKQRTARIAVADPKGPIAQVAAEVRDGRRASI